jgi:regulatory protein
MKITRIERQKKNPRRKNVYADGQFVLGLSDETLLKAGLRIGDELNKDDLTTLQEKEGLLSARNTALRYLSYRPRTEREIRDKLREKEFADDEIARVLADLKNAGLVNDAEFAKMFIRNALTRKPVGRALLKQKMFLLGLTRENIDPALAEFEAETDVTAIAIEAGRTYLRKAPVPRSREQRQKIRNRLSGFLIRRGFAWDVVRKAVDTLLNTKP